MSCETIPRIVVQVKREQLKDVTILAGLDRGNSLTKIIFVPKSKPTNESGDSYQLVCAVFLNKNFDSALNCLKEEALLPDKGIFHVTGPGGLIYAKTISTTLSLETVFIDEYLSQCRGLHFLLNNVDGNELFYPKPEMMTSKCAESDSKEDNQSSLPDYKKVENCATSCDDKFPCLFGVLGSGSPILKVQANGMGSLVGSAGLGGKTYIGLAKCLVGSNDYNEIGELASGGRSTNLESRMTELVEIDNPILGLHNAFEQDVDLEALDRADVARGLIFITVTNILGAAKGIAADLETAKLYMGGHLMRNLVFREETELLNQSYGEARLDIKYLRIGHTGAFGAMISNPGDEKIFYEI